jgi:hypothetical protein
MRRARAWQRWAQHKRWQRRRDRELRRAAANAARDSSRAQRSRFGVVGMLLAVGIGIVFAIAWTTPVAFVPYAAVDAPAPAFATESAPAPGVPVPGVPVPGVPVPGVPVPAPVAPLLGAAGSRFVDPATAEPVWVALADDDERAARELLRQHLESLAVFAPRHLELAVVAPLVPADLPAVFGLRGDELEAMQRAVQRLAEASRYSTKQAEALRKYGRDALLHAAVVLEQGGLAGHRSVGANLGRFLQESTGFRAIPLPDDGASTAVRADQSRACGRLWHWMLHEVARSDAAWRAFGSLQK